MDVMTPTHKARLAEIRERHAEDSRYFETGRDGSVMALEAHNDRAALLDLIEEMRPAVELGEAYAAFREAHEAWLSQHPDREPWSGHLRLPHSKRDHGGG